MAVLAGALIEQGLSPTTDRVTSDIDTNPMLFAVAAHVDLLTPAGAPTRTVAAAYARSLDGYKARSYTDDYYYRIHISPNPLSFGNLVTTTTQSVILWNAYFETKTLSSALLTNGDGISISSPVAVPSNLAPLRYITYDVTAHMDGPPLMDATYTVIIGGETMRLSITGQRIVPFLLPPNWRDGVTETFGFLTDVLRSQDGTEQRISLRGKPRRRFEYRFVAAGSQWQQLQPLLWGWHKYPFAVPVWTDRAILTADIAVGVVSIPIETSTSRSFVVGGLCALVQNSTVYEAGVIDAVNPTSITLRLPTTRAWAKGSALYPMVTANLPETLPMTRETDNVIVGNALFDCEVGTTDARLPVAAAAVTYGGVEVITAQPNWSGGLQHDNTQASEVIDNDTSWPVRFVTEGFARSVRAHRWLLGSKTEIDAFRAMLKRLNGRQKIVHLPSFSDDLPMAASASSGAIDIEVDVPNLGQFITPTGPYRFIQVVLSNGTTKYHTITSVTSYLGHYRLGVSPALDYNIVLGQVQRVSFMPLFRLQNDEVSLQWLSDSVATAELSFVLVTG